MESLGNMVRNKYILYWPFEFTCTCSSRRQIGLGELWISQVSTIVTGQYSNSYTVRNRSGAAEITIYATSFCLPTASIFVFGCGCSCGKLQTPLKWRLWLFDYLLSLPKWNYFCRTAIMQNQAGSGSLVLTDSAQDTYAYLERKTFVIALLGTADTAYNS